MLTNSHHFTSKKGCLVITFTHVPTIKCLGRISPNGVTSAFMTYNHPTEWDQHWLYSYRWWNMVWTTNKENQESP